ncbi:MAG: hypothetical protein JRD89_09835, partial [Deltaproteobacteria bacterium]|nr:hypothetical protein [Deltaproteobacteria bacterium]
SEKKVCVHVHVDDDVKFLDNRNQELDIPLYRYLTPRDIMENIRRSWVNVVYPPRDYAMSHEVIEEIIRRSFIEKFPGVVDRELFWYEMIHTLLKHKRPEDFYSLILDEADDIFPDSPRTPRYQLQDWFRATCLRDLRKTKLSFYVAFQTHIDFDYYILAKIPAKIYLKGAFLPSGKYTVVKRSMPRYLRRGEYIIEKNGLYGKAKFPKIDTSDQVRAVFA